jgi:hypothetical protein
MGLINLAQNKDKWQALVNIVINQQVPQTRGISRLAGKILASQDIWKKDTDI